jgi:hypothetical protein
MRMLNPRRLTAAFLLLSAALAVLLLGVRNLYDDEIFSLYLVTSPVREILSITAQGDVHPPGMYLLAHLAWLAVPSFRWMNLIPGAVLYGGLAVFLLATVPLFERVRSQICVLMLATLHPQLLMWDVTFRWYSWWAGVALMAATVALQPGRPRPALSLVRAVMLGVLLAGLFYLNYIALLFAMALAMAMVVRYWAERLGPTALRGLVFAGVFLVLIAPQIHTMLAVHLPDGGAQRSVFVVSALRLAQGVGPSEAYLPWHPLAIAAGMVFVWLGWLGVRRLVWEGPTSSNESSPVAAILVCGVVFFLLVAVTGLGGKPRNALILIPLLAPGAALVLETLRPRVQTALLLFFVVWSGVGIAHLIGGYGLTKSDRIDHPEQVVASVERELGQAGQPGCAVVVTYDGLLAFELAQARLPRLIIVSPFQDPNFGGLQTLPSGACDHARLYGVESYVAGNPLHADALNGELRVAEGYIEGPQSIDRFSFDPDAAMKRRVAGLPVVGGDLRPVTRLPDYRYVVTSGVIERASVEAMRRRMGLFASGSVN